MTDFVHLIFPSFKNEEIKKNINDDKKRNDNNGLLFS